MMQGNEDLQTMKNSSSRQKVTSMEDDDDDCACCDHSHQGFEEITTHDHAHEHDHNDFGSGHEHSHSHSNGHNHGNGHEHGHDHGVHQACGSSKQKVTFVEDDDDDCACCDHSHKEDVHSQTATTGHNHSHGHAHEHGDNSYGGGHDHGHSHELSSRKKVAFVDDDDDCACCDHGPKDVQEMTGHDHVHGHAHDHGHTDCGCYDHGPEHEHGHSSKQKVTSVEDDDDDCACCDHSAKESQEIANHDHGHSHGHSNTCCGGGHDHDHNHGRGCSHDSGHGHDHSHGHSHNHNDGGGCCGSSAKKASVSCCDEPMKKCNLLEGEEDDECCSSGCCDTNKTPSALIPSTELNVSVEIESSQKLDNNPTAVSGKEEPVEDEVIITRTLVCQSCDPSSEILHVIQVTRFRVANLCCAGEEKIIREALGKMTGVEHVAVNIVGRYAVVKHCAVDCCAPGQKIVDTLNDLHLGVSIHEVADGEDENEKQDMVDIYELAHVLTVAVLFLVGLVLYLHQPTTRYSKWIFICSIIIGMFPIIHSSFIALFIRHTIDINTLIVIAVAGALAAREYFDASLVVAMFLAAELIESVVMVQVRNAIKLSTSTTIPKKAYLTDGKTISIEDLKIGDVIAIRAGEMIVCDGKVVKGEGVVDESSLTGEAVPVVKKVNSLVLSGTVVQNGYLEIETTKNAQDSTLKQLKQAVEDVQADRGEYAKLVDKFASYWTPAILLTTLGLILIGGGITGNWWGYLHRGLVLLILACPCAIVVSAPIPSVCAIATAAKGGVLIKGSTIIEKMCLVDTVAVDKTGTLTKGYFQVQDQLYLVQESEVGYDPLKLAVALEAKSTHPLANAIVSAYCGCIAEMADIVLPTVKKVKVLEGVGLEGWVEVEEHDWRHICVGNERLLKEFGGKVSIPDKKHQKQVQDFISQAHGKSVLLIVIDDEINCLLSLSDEVRKESKAFVQALQEEHHIGVTMLTGDHESVAKQICEEVGLKDIAKNLHARLVPEQKLQWIKDSQTIDHKKVLMIGDGINDSTALACSTVGVAMGAGGTAMAVAAADVVLLNDNLSLLPLAIQLCHLTKNTILQNCIFAIVIKVLAIILAILGLLEFWHAVLIDIGALLIVVANGTKVLAFHKFKALQQTETKVTSVANFNKDTKEEGKQDTSPDNDVLSRV